MSSEETTPDPQVSAGGMDVECEKGAISAVGKYKMCGVLLRSTSGMQMSRWDQSHNGMVCECPPRVVSLRADLSADFCFCLSPLFVVCFCLLFGECSLFIDLCTHSMPCDTHLSS